MSPRSVTSQARKGVLALLIRQGIMFPINFLASVLLARMLFAADQGGYAIVSFLVMGLSLLFEGGLGSVLIQQPEEPTPEQMRSVFTFYLLAFGGLTVLFWVFAPWLAVAFHLPYQGPWMLRVMSLSMLVGTFGAIPTFMLERRMRFEVFARVDVATLLLERAVTLSLAFLGFGAWCYVWGTLASATVRMALVLRASPWPMGLALDRGLLEHAVGKGLYFQGLNFTYMARDNMNTVLGGTFFGPHAVGYLNWGQNLPTTASSPFIQIAQRVCFPAFARLHDAAEEREKLLIRTLQVLNLVTFPALALIAATGPQIVSYIYGEPWRPGLIALYCFAARLALKNVTAILVEYLNARGRVKETFKLTSWWTGVEWVLALALLPWCGFNAIAYAYAAGPVFATLWLLRAVRAEARIPYARTFGLPLVGTAVSVAAGLVGVHFVAHSYTLFALLGACLGLGLLVAACFERELLLAGWQAWRARRAGAPAAEATVPASEPIAQEAS